MDFKQHLRAIEELEAVLAARPQDMMTTNDRQFIHDGVELIWRQIQCMVRPNVIEEIKAKVWGEMSKKQTAQELLDAIALTKLDLNATDRFKTKQQMADRERFKADERRVLESLEAELNRLYPHR